MFKRLDSKLDSCVTITIDGKPFKAAADETVAAAVLLSGMGYTRTTPVSAMPRAPLCLMGVCYECLMIIDGQPNRRACQEYVVEGMRIERQHGTGALPQ